MAKRYSCLPSEILRRGNTIDLWCMEFSVGYENYVRRKQERGEPLNHGKSQEELQAMIERAEARNASKNDKK